VAEHLGSIPATAGSLWTGSAPTGSRRVLGGLVPGDRTKRGHGLLSRNFDFPTATLTELVGLPPLVGERPLAADPWVVEVHPDRGYASVTVGSWT